MRARCLLVVAAVTFVAVACGSPTSPSAPSSAPLSVAGAWNGTSVDSQGTTVVDWTITQVGTAVSGTVTTRAPDPNDGSCNACHRNKSGTIAMTRK